MRTSADTFPVVGGRCTGRARRCKAKQGRREDGADVWIPSYTVVRFLGRVKGGKIFFWKRGAPITSPFVAFAPGNCRDCAKPGRAVI
jgi:hypothetical protein